MTIAKCLEMFSSAGLIEKELLLAALLKKARLWVLTNGDFELAPEICQNYIKSCEKMVNGEPLAYIVGYKRFYDVDFRVSPAVLIPRQETEELVEHIKIVLDENANYQLIADLGAGSGAIGLSLARMYPNRYFQLVDVSKEALYITAENQKMLALTANTAIIHSNLLAMISNNLPQLIVANLPYIGDNVWADMSDSVRNYEPKLALYAGRDGLDLYKELLIQVVKFYRVGEYPEMWWEISPEQKSLIESWDIPEYTLNFYQDLSERWRFVRLRAN